MLFFLIVDLSVVVLCWSCRSAVTQAPTQTTSQAPTACQMVFCFVDPCTVNSCPGVPTATCRSNYCGGCYAHFFNAAGENVTSMCSQLSCPPPGLGGICVEGCRNDADCRALGSDFLCCSNGCGRSCIRGISPPTTATIATMATTATTTASKDRCVHRSAMK